MIVNEIREYPTIAIGCCLFERAPNYQAVISSIEGMAEVYPGTTEAFLYFSGADRAEAEREIERLSFRYRGLFDFSWGPNRGDEPKYRLALKSDAEFILTVDDDCTFGSRTMVHLMNVFKSLNGRAGSVNRVAAVGWFGSEIQRGVLLTPIEDRYGLTGSETQRVDYLGSCGSLYRREVLEDERLRRERWPEFIGSASDLWLSYLIQIHYRQEMYITGVEKCDLAECGHSLWLDSISARFASIVNRLVEGGWGGTV